MAAKKRSISLDEDVALGVERAASEDGVSVSAWLSRAAADRLRLREGLRGVAEWEAGAGALSPAEIAAGQLLLERLVPSKAPVTRARRAATRPLGQRSA